jgi:cytidylate kinase
MRTYDTFTHGLAATRIDDYLTDRSRAAQTPSGQPPRRGPVITISSMMGIPATEIANQVARELELHVFDREVLLEVEGATHLGDRLVNALDRGQRSALDAWIQGWLNLGHRVIDPRSFHHLVSRVIRSIGLHGGAVILGRGANFVLAGTGAFHVRLVAGLELRACAVAGGAEPLTPQSLTPQSLERARRELVADAGRRRRFIHRYFRVRRFKADIDDLLAYDAIFNLPALDPALGAGLIVDGFRRAAARKVRTPGPAPGVLVD